MTEFAEVVMEVERFIAELEEFVWIADVVVDAPPFVTELTDEQWLQYGLPAVARRAVDEKWISGVYDLDMVVTDTRGKPYPVLIQRLFFNYFTSTLETM